jgi:hypothetical protein
MSRIRIGILSPIIVASFIAVSACQGSIQNAGEIPSTPNRGIEASTTSAGYTLTDLGALPGSPDSSVSRGLQGISAFGGNPLNNLGQIVGFAGFPGQSYPRFIPATQHAIIFKNNGAVDLNTLIPSNSGYTLNFAVAINDGGRSR